MREVVSFRKRIWRLLHPRRPVVLDGHRVDYLLDAAQHTQHSGFYLMGCSLWHRRLKVRPAGTTTPLGEAGARGGSSGTIIFPRPFGSGPIEAEQVRQAILANWRAWVEPEHVRALFDDAMKSPRHRPISTFVKLSCPRGEKEEEADEDVGLFVPKGEILAELEPGSPSTMTIGNALKGTSINYLISEEEAVEFDERSLTVTIRGLTVAGLLSVAVGLGRTLDVENLVVHDSDLGADPFLFLERLRDPRAPGFRGRVWPTGTPNSELPPELRDDWVPPVGR